MAKKFMRDMSYSELMDEAKANSAAWHTADEQTRKDLENRNNAIYSYSDAVYGTKTTPLSKDGTREHTFDADSYYQSLVSKGREGGSRSTYSPQPIPSFGEWMQGSEYQMLSDQYSKLGQQSMENILAQLSARTGGLASSYAASAAQQGYNDYMGQLMDVARSMYEGDRAAMLAENEAAYDRYRDSVNDANYENQLQYNRYRDSVNDANYERQLLLDRAAQQAAQDEKNKAEARDRVETFLSRSGDLSALDSELLGATGLTDAELHGYADYYTNLIAAQQAEAAKKSTGGGDEPKPKLGVLDTILGMDRDHAEDYLMSNVDKENVARYLAMYDAAKAEPTVSNKVSADGRGQGIEIPRHGYFTWDSIVRLVDDGRVKEEYDEETNTYTYSWVG